MSYQNKQDMLEVAARAIGVDVEKERRVYEKYCTKKLPDHWNIWLARAVAGKLG